MTQLYDRAVEAIAAGVGVVGSAVLMLRQSMLRRSSTLATTERIAETPGAVTGPPKPRVRVSRDGWIRNDGGGFPFHPGALVELAFDDGRVLLKPHGVETAGYWHESWWRREATIQGRNIAFYRIVRLAPPMTTAPRIA